MVLPLSNLDRLWVKVKQEVCSSVLFPFVWCLSVAERESKTSLNKWMSEQHTNTQKIHQAQKDSVFWKIESIFPNYQNYTCCENDLKDNKHNSLHLARKYAQIFVLGHYPFLEAHSFPWAKLSETVCFSEKIMSMDKYPSIISHQMVDVLTSPSSCTLKILPFVA